MYVYGFKASSIKSKCMVQCYVSTLISDGALVEHAGQLAQLLSTITIDAEGLGLDSWVCQIRHSVANSSPSLWRFCGTVLPMR